MSDWRNECTTSFQGGLSPRQRVRGCGGVAGGLCEEKLLSCARGCAGSGPVSQAETLWGVRTLLQKQACSRSGGQPHSLGCWGTSAGGQIQALPPELIEDERVNELDTSVEMIQSEEKGKKTKKIQRAPETSKRQVLLTQEEENDIEA